MKVFAAILLLWAPLASGFAPAARPAAVVARSKQHPSSANAASSRPLMVMAAASSHEEDLALTRQIIMDYIAATDLDSAGVVDDDGDSEGVGAAATETSPRPAAEQPKKKQKKKKKSPPPAAPVEIDISKLNIVVGVINKAWEHEEADKLFCEEIDVGEAEPRQIASGLRAHYSAADLTGRRVLVLANLKTRKLVGFPSHGMVLCASTDDGSKVVFVDPPEDATIGERVRVGGFDGEPATENQVLKKKMLDAIFPELRTDAAGAASYRGVPLMAGTGRCVAEGGLAEVQVS
ncbi:hypothetical protein ACHAXT_007663 [Thalassiosira profunda]